MLEVQYKGKKTGLVKDVININRTGDEPFLGSLIEKKYQFLIKVIYGKLIYI